MIVVHSQLRPRSKRVWDLDLVLDHSALPMILNAESSGGVITPVSEHLAADAPQAHGYMANPKSELADAGEAIPHGDVMSFAETQTNAARFAAEKVDEISKRRAKRTANRVQDALMKARAKGVDPTDQVAAIEAAVEKIDEAVRRAA